MCVCQSGGIDAASAVGLEEEESNEDRVGNKLQSQRRSNASQASSARHVYLDEPDSLSESQRRANSLIGQRISKAIPNQSADSQPLTDANKSTSDKSDNSIRRQEKLSAAPSSSGSQVSVHDKSMAQARYLYSTLTSNAAALLVASAAPQSPSPTRSHAVQRKQAQFVDRHQRQGRLGAPATEIRAVGVPSPCPEESGESGHSSAASSGRRQARPGQLTAANFSEPDSSDSDDQAEARKRPAHREQSARGGIGRESTNQSEDEFRDKISQRPPSIVESQYESQRRFSGHSSTHTSRSESLNMDSQLQQVAPAMDPATHALWAQGAELDTGNGNFIMATRRRRSMHAIHQVQLHQIQQQQLQLQQNQPHTKHLSIGSFQSCSEQAQTSSSNKSSFGMHDSDKMPEMSASSLVFPVSRTLKSEMRKLRTASSIDECPAERLSDRCPRGGADSVHSKRLSLTTISQRDKFSVEPDTSNKLDDSDDSSEAKLDEQQSDGSQEKRDEEKNESRRYYLTDTDYDLDELEANNSLLANLYEWNFPIFELHQQYSDSILSKLSYRIFYDSGFFECKYEISSRADSPISVRRAFDCLIRQLI